MSNRTHATGASLAFMVALLLLVVYTSTSLAAGNILSWTVQFGTGSGVEEIATSVSTDDGLIVAGTTTGALPGETNAGGIDGWVRRYDLYGNLLWSSQFGTAGDDVVHGVAGNMAGGVFIVGSTTGAFPGESNAGGRDIFARKYELDGLPGWTDQIGSAGDDELLDVDTYSTYGIRVVGRTNGNLSMTSLGGYDALYGSVGADGGFSLVQFGTSGDDAATGMVTLAENIPYISGYTDGTLPDQSSAGGRDAFLAKFEYNFTPVWMRQFGTSGDDQANGVALNDNSVFVGGSTTGVFPGETLAGGIDAFMASYDVSGNEQWLTQFGTTGDDVVEDVSGTAVLPMSFAVGSTTGVFSGETSAGSTDAFAARFDVAGNRLWTDQFGTTGIDVALGGELDFGLQHLYPVGFVSGALPGQLHAGSRDAFIMKFIQDNDDDGIFNDVDVLAYDFTYEFNDSTTEVPTNGQIVDHGDVYLTISDSVDATEGVLVTASNNGGGGDPADVQFCTGIADTQLDPGDAIEVTCGSAKIGVVAGTVDTTFISPEGINTTTSYDVGNTLKYDPGASSFVADENNVDSILVNIGATDQLIGPGKTVKLVSLLADSFLREGHPNQNEGANPFLVLRKQGSTRPVVQFDLSAISLAGLTKATLVMSIASTPSSSWGNAGRPIEVRRLLQSWTEGNGKDVDVPESESTRGSGDGITWSCAIDSNITNHQQNCATDWNGGSLATRTAPTVNVVNGMTGEISFDVTQDVLNGASNGWLVKKVDENKAGNIYFYSKEGASGDASLAPKLILEYE